MCKEGFKEVQEGIEGIQTYGVSGNPYGEAVDHPYKIDYIFLKNIKVLYTSTILNTYGSFVSDHCGIYAEIDCIG